MWSRSFYAAIVIFLFSKTLVAQKFEAEEAILSNGATIINNSSASGGAYVAQGEGSVSITFNMEHEGYYDIFINASSPHGDKINLLVLNGSSVSFGLSKNSQFIKIKLVSQHKLKAGTYQMDIRKSWGYINIDYIELQKNSGGQKYSINNQLVNFNASTEAIALYDFLIDNYTRKIISGVMTLNSMDESEWLKEQTGKEPALLGIDFMHSGRGYDWYNDLTPAIDAQTWYERNGIPALMWHWRDPSKKTEAFYAADTQFDLSKILDETSPEFDSLISDIDYVSGIIKILQDKNIPVIWRPLHEAAGGWFWWGSKGPEPCKRLFQLMYDRMVNHHGLNNLIWVWTREPNDDAWYPGDEYVDIIGRDIYKTGDHDAQELEFNHMNSIYGGSKLLSLSETGSFPDPDKLIEREAAWSWFMPWYGQFVRNEYYNTLQLWQKTMNHEYVITLDEMPDLKTYERQNPDPGSEIVVALEEADEIFPTVRAYPNAVIDILTVESNFLITSIKIFNVKGDLLKESIPDQYAAELSFSGFPAGIYILRVNESKSLRILKK